MGCGPSKSGGGGDPLLTAEQRHNKGHHMAAAEQANQSGTSTPYYNRAKDRVDAIAESQTVTVGNNTQLTYAYVSQRGFYPDEPFKANQDAYCVHLPLLTSSTDNKESNADSSTTKDDAFFAVFDGHGKDGDGCAIFAKHDLPVQLQQELLENVVSTNNNSPANSKSHRKIQNALKRAHLTTNQNLRQEVTVDDSLSGTTAISIYFHGNKRITISNLGDSRAVLGQIEEKTDASTASTSRTMSSTSNHSGNSNNGNSSRHNNNNNKQSSLSVKALPLSRDQTPYRKDERNRIRATGARVLSLDQLEGLEPIEASENNEDSCDMLNLGEELDEGGDPPRVWHPIDDYPGTAFTRSIGDALAEELGVFAQPEMLTREIQPHDKILVLASDGVYEFLTNQSVIDICAKFQDPKEACHAVVAEAYELWLQYELRTDDITIICIFIDHIEEEDKEDKEDTTKTTAPSAPASKRMLDSSIIETVDNMSLMAEGLRPVRKNVSKEKSKAIEKLKLQGKSMRIDVAAATEETVDLKQLATPKTAQEISAISEAIKASVMFRNVNHEQRQLIYSCMESIQVKAGTWVIRQGTVGDRFYIVDNGQFEVRIIPDGEEDPTGEGGHVIHQYEGSRERHAHPSFGELALMHSAPRSASIIAKTDGQLWALHRAAFRQILIQAQDHRKDLKKVLKKIPYFANLDSDGINKLAAIHEDITFGRGDNITEQGQPGEKMFVVESGSAYCTQISGGETKRTTIKAGSYFGDEIFDNDNDGSGKGKYKQTIVAMQTTTCWQLDATLLQQTMGPLLLARGSD